MKLFILLVIIVTVHGFHHGSTAYTRIYFSQFNSKHTQTLHLPSTTQRPKQNNNIYSNIQSSLKASTPETPDTSQSPPLNISIPYAGLWIGLISFAFFLSPGELNSPADTALINELLSNPTSPSCNHIWFMIWNFFAVAPLSLAALLLPGSKFSKLPATPFVLGSAALGYFALGPYMITRNPSEGPVSKSDLGFVTKNVFESKVFAVLVTFLAASIPLTSGVIPDIMNGNGAELVSGFIDLFMSSKFVSVATADIALLTILAALLIPEDMERRGMEPSPIAGLATLLLPVLGPCLYFVLRDELDE